MEQKGSAKPTNSFMDTSIGGKSLKEYMSIIKMPLLALIGLAVVNFLFGLLAYIPGLGIIFGWLGLVMGFLLSLIGIIITGYIGYVTVKKHSGDLLNASFAGGLAGFISGIVGAVLSLITTSIGLGMRPGFGGVIGMTAAMVALVISPIFELILGGILALIGGLIAGARTFGPQGPAQQQTTKPGV
jgi:hypothetical protein